MQRLAELFTDTLSRRRSSCVLILLLLLTASTLASPAGDDIKKLISRAQDERRAGLLDEAEKTLGRAVTFDPSRADAKVELAYIFAKQRRLLDAYNLVLPIVEADAKNSRALSVLGMTLLAGGRFNDARMILYKAIQLNKKEHLAWHGFGLLEFYENHIKDSRKDLEQAVYYEGDEPDYIFALAQISARDELYVEAADAYEKFLAISKETDIDRRDRIKGLVNFLRYLGHINAIYRSTAKDSTTVPFELVGNRPVITVRVNDRKEPLRFVLDTGSGMSVLSEDTAKRMKIKAVTRGGYARGIGGDGKFAIVYGFLKQVDVGDVTIRDVPVYIRKFHNDGGGVDGYIGLALISKFLTTIDYGAQTFSLVKKDDPPAPAAVRAADISLPLRLTSSGFLSGEVELQGVDSTLNFIVDTGASVSVISDRVASAESVTRYLSQNEKLRVVGSAGVTDDVKTFVLPRVTFGKNTCTDVTAVALDLDLINEASGFEQSGILGGNFLKNYRLTFDFKRSRVTFVSLKPDNE